MKIYSAERVRTHTADGTIAHGSVVVDDEGLIAWVGASADLPPEYADADRVSVEVWPAHLLRLQREEDTTGRVG